MPDQLKFVVGSAFGVILTLFVLDLMGAPKALKQYTQARTAVKVCEATIPRNQHCQVVISAEVAPQKEVHVMRNGKEVVITRHVQK